MLQVVTWNFTSVMWRISHLVWEHEQANVQFPLLGNLMKSLSNKFGCLAIDFTELGPKVQALACPGIFFLWGGGTFLPGKVLKGLCRGSRGTEAPRMVCKFNFWKVKDVLRKLIQIWLFGENFQQIIGIFWGKLTVIQENCKQKLKIFTENSSILIGFS